MLRSHNIHSIHGPVINPFNLGEQKEGQRSAGGSSGGSAAAVAFNMCDVYGLIVLLYFSP